MRKWFAPIVMAGAAALVSSLVTSGPAGADPSHGSPPGPFHGPFGLGAPVFVQTNDPAGNQVVSYLQTGGGLHQVERASTGGDGVAIPGSVVDKLASQSSLADDLSEHLLVAVNGGSDTITTFRTAGPQLFDRHVASSGGSTPVSVAVFGDLVYVLNAGGTGSVQGYYADSLTPIPGSNRSLGLTPGLTPAFLNTPGQIGFSPDGHDLIVTTKANGSDIDVFGVTPQGGLSAAPTVNPSATPVPFGFTFDKAGDLVVSEAGVSALTTYRIGAGDALTELGSVTDGQAALCWVTSTRGGFFFGANAGSGTVTAYTIDSSGQPTVVSTNPTAAGPIDLAASPDGSTLYVETGGSDVLQAFSVSSTGTLNLIGSVSPELPGGNGLEGIAVG